MSDREFDSFLRRHKHWVSLHERIANAKRQRDWPQVVALATEAGEYARKNRDLSIVTWMLDKEAARAHEKLGDLPRALAAWERAAAGCKDYRARERLREPDDFLKDLTSMHKKIGTLKTKLGVPA